MPRLTWASLQGVYPARAAIHAALLALRFAPLGRCQITLNTGKSPAGEVAVFLLKLDTDVTAMQERGGNQAAAGTCERVEHRVARFGKGLDRLHQRIASMKAEAGSSQDIIERLHQRIASMEAEAGASNEARFETYPHPASFGQRSPTKTSPRKNTRELRWRLFFGSPWPWLGGLVAVALAGVALYFLWQLAVYLFHVIGQFVQDHYEGVIISAVIIGCLVIWGLCVLIGRTAVIVIAVIGLALYFARGLIWEFAVLHYFVAALIGAVIIGVAVWAVREAMDL